MSKKPIEMPKIGFNEALKRISKYDKEKLPDKLKNKNKENPTLKNSAGKND